MMSQAGFTVLEVVVAFTILSIVTIVSVGIVTQNSMRVNTVEKQLVAMQLAETALAEVNGAVSSIKSAIKKEYQGESATGYKWVASVNPYQTRVVKAGHSPVLPLWQVKLEVFAVAQKQPLISMSTVMPGR